MQVEFWIYTLHGKKKEYNWVTDQEDIVDTELSSVVISDPSVNLCIGGYRLDGRYLQYDSYEAYHADGYFCEKTEGEMFVTSKHYKIPETDLSKYLIP